jgi:hypothetical protein
MNDWNWKEPHKLNIFDIIDYASDKIKKLFKPNERKLINDSNTIHLIVDRSTMQCPIDDMHTFRCEYGRTSHGPIESSYYCNQCGKHYLRNEMIISTPDDWQVPPSAKIPVALSGVKEAEWILEEDERKI